MSTKLQQLTSHLLGKRLARNEDIESWVDRCSIIPEARHMGEYAEICQQQSTCTVVIERFSGDARKIMALVTAWLQDNDDNRERFGLGDPEIDVTPLDKSGKSSDVDISLVFYDPVMVRLDTDGDIHWQGLRWSLIDDPLVDTAEEVAEVDPQGPGDE
ncbi:phage tail protein [Endozoicomonas montiporae]|uniref:Uncharacterized protein n=1 Tax=Endozoicomonas montiporae CL-33 TaxID=570277 RepID=A0A142BB56_9GAMM|nr:phage tail protein [Endozoicomonas montiporae]AMO55982.1 hypothetical protein EZMO1_1839 [Endozoicomonas montiporae CL-33]